MRLLDDVVRVRLVVGPPEQAHGLPVSRPRDALER
jgi:hypothetical protein